MRTSKSEIAYSRSASTSIRRVSSRPPLRLRRGHRPAPGEVEENALQRLHRPLGSRLDGGWHFWIAEARLGQAIKETVAEAGYPDVRLEHGTRLIKRALDAAEAEAEDDGSDK